MKFTKAEIMEARKHLLKMLPPGSTVFTRIVHVAKSGMYRTVDLYVIEDNQPIRISYLVSKATGLRYDEKHEAIGMSGCGMDMAFAAVYDLGATLYPNGHTCALDKCRSNDHSNNPTMKHDKEITHKDGGYALIQRSF